MATVQDSFSLCRALPAVRMNENSSSALGRRQESPQTSSSLSPLCVPSFLLTRASVLSPHLPPPFLLLPFLPSFPPLFLPYTLLAADDGLESGETCALASV